jgi:hypothetical protein
MTVNESIQPKTGRDPRELLRRAVDDAPAAFDRDHLVAWFARNFPQVEPLVVEGLIGLGTVNNPGRRHFPRPVDVLFAREDGWLERYAPERHGLWTTVGTPLPTHRAAEVAVWQRRAPAGEPGAAAAS